MSDPRGLPELGSTRERASRTGTDPDLVDVRAAQRDRRAFDRLYRRYLDRVYSYSFYQLGDHHEAEDVTERTFLAALAGIDGFTDEGATFRAWLFRIAHNAFANHQRARGRQGRPLPEELPGRDGSPEEHALSQEALAGLAQAVGRLPTEYRAALLLRAEEGLSFRQIAEVMGLTEETARWRVFKARQKLLQALGPATERERP
jgi:RNA polymerase sigma-70 factor, ECF subfamily